MLNKKHIILLLTLTILLIGVASATEVSNDTTGTDTQKTLTDTTNDMDNNIETSINTEKTLKKISTEENNKKTDTDTYTTTASNYNELVNKVNEAKTSGYKTYTINLTPGDYNATATMTWGDSISTDTLVINGNGITLNGQNKYQFMKILKDHSLSLNNITITNYTSGWGGAICIDYGNLTLDHVIFKNNVVLYGDGGAIINYYGILTIFNSDFTQNQVKTDLGFGGAISNWRGTITIYNSNFNQNSLESDGGVVTGGAICNSEGTITVINTNFTENTAEIGGAIDNDDDLTLINCTFTKNTAGSAGAIRNGDGTLNISNCTFSNNVAEEYGGAIYIRNDYYDDISVNPIIISSYFNNNLPFELLENNQKYNIKLYDDIVSSDNVDIYLDNAYDGNYRINDNIIEWNKKLTIGEHEINIEANDNNIITFNVNVNSSANQGKSIDKNTKNNSETKESSDNNNKTDNQTSSDDTNQSKTGNKNSEPLPYSVIKKDQTYSKFDNNLKQVSAENHNDNNILTLETGFNVTLSWLNNLFKQDFANREILIYIDGILVYNSTTSDNLSDILFTILEEYKGEHTLKVVTDENVYTKRVNII